MKRIVLTVFLVISATAFIFFVSGNKFFGISNPKKSATEVSQTLPAVTMTLDDGSSVATISGIRATTAYDALQQFSAARNLPLETDQFDFGVFVKKIGDKQSLRDMAWIFFVNGKSAEAAADKYLLNDGDSVEWKYIRPDF